MNRLVLALVILTASVASGERRKGPAPVKPTPRAPATNSAKPTTTNSAKPSATNSARPSATKTYAFTGLEIDGRLKTPQLIYFLNRMKSEFDTTAPDKRSFLPELKRSPDEM